MGNGQQKNPIDYRDLVAAQALALCDTDQIVNEITSRCHPDEKIVETVLKDFKTNMLLTELSYRAQKIAMTLIEAQNMITMSEMMFSMGSLFPMNHQDLDGYYLTGSKDD